MSNGKLLEGSLNDVHAAFSEVNDPKLLGKFYKTNANVIKALQDYEEFLKDTLLPASNEDFRLGVENFQKKLLYEEMVDIPLDRLLQIAYDDLHRNQEWLKAVAAQINRNKTLNQIWSNSVRITPRRSNCSRPFAMSWGACGSFW